MVVVLPMSGCGSGGNDTNTESNREQVASIAFNDGASVSILASGNGKYVVHGEKLNGVAGVDLSISYDASKMSSPAVTLGDLLSGAMFAANPTNPIRVAIVSTRSYSGSGDIATITFATDNGTGGLSFSRLSMIDASGHRIY